MDDVPILTAKELRSQRAREWYAALSVEEKAALVQKNRENRERRKSTSGIVLNQSLHNGRQTVNCQPSFQPEPSPTPGVLGDISNLSAVERRRKRARDRYASMSLEEKERLLQKNREYRQLKKDGTSTNLSASTTVTGKQGHQVMLTPQRQPFADLTAQGFNEVDVDSMGDCVLPTSCITQLKQGGSLVVAHQSAITDTPFTPANVLTKDCIDDYSWLRRNDAYERTTRYGEVEDNDYQNGDTSQEIMQPPTNVELMEGEAIVHDVDDDDDDDEGYLMRGRDVSAVVCDVGPVDHYANFPNSVREVALMDSNYQVAFLRAFDEVTDFYQSQLITSETRRGIVVATALEVDKASNCLSTTATTTMLFLNNRDFQRYALLEEVRNSLFKEPVLHDTIKIGVTFRKQELLQMAEQNNASGARSGDS